MTEAFLEDLFANLPSDLSFVKIKTFINSKLLDKLLDHQSKNSNFINFFTWFYSHEKDLKLRFPQTFSSIRISFCETMIQILKNIDIKEAKSSGFLSAFQLYLCRSLSETLNEMSLINLEEVFLILALIIDLFRKTRGFCPELFSGFRRILSFLNTNFNEIEEIELYLKWTILLINSMFILLSNDVNLDVLMRENVSILEEILNKTKEESLKKELFTCVDKVKTAVKEAELKNHLTIFKEKALIKIKQLTPRIVEERKRYEKDETPAKGRIKSLKNQLKINSKKIKKQLIEDKIINLKENMLKEEHIVEKKWILMVLKSFFF